MKCCQCEGIEREFDATEAEHEIEAYRKEGPAETTQILIDALTEQGVDGLTLLDIGGGVGAIQHAMLSAGASTATAVEASTAFAKAAQEEAKELGWSERVDVRHGDFIDLAEAVVAHDIVTLDRVICWSFYYADYGHLAGSRYVYWNIFGKPEQIPRFATGFPDTWWIDTAKEEMVASGQPIEVDQAATH